MTGSYWLLATPGLLLLILLDESTRRIACELECDQVSFSYEGVQYCLAERGYTQRKILVVTWRNETSENPNGAKVLK